MIVNNFNSLLQFRENYSGANPDLEPGKTPRFSALMDSEALNAAKRNPVGLFLSTEEIDQKLKAANNGIDKSSLISQGVAEDTNTASGSALTGRERQSASVIVATFTASQPPSAPWLIIQDFNPDVNLPGYISGQDGIGPISNCTGNTERTVYLYALEGKESTQENPIMYVWSYKGKENVVGHWYKVSVNEVNPLNATREEMFAYITHMYKNDGDALFCATRNFGVSDEFGVELGWFSEGQERRNYVSAFNSYADICKGYLASADYTERMNNIPAGARDYTQMSFDILLGMISNMTERSEQFEKREHEERRDIGKPREPEEIADKQELAKAG